MALKPPRLPLVGVASLESAFPARAATSYRPDGAVSDLASDESVENFNMATPRKAKGDASRASRHYIGSPRAEAILSAFLDFDDQDVAAAEGPPLDFDEAMAALEEKAQPSTRGRTADEEPEFTKSCRGPSGRRSGGCKVLVKGEGLNAADECDSSGSTMCTEGSPGAACYNSDNSDTEDQEDSEEEREEDYESDFETDSGSEYETDEDDECINGVESTVAKEQAKVARQASLADYGRDLPQIPPPRSKGSRAGSRASSRAGSRSGNRASSRTGGHRDRQSSRVRGDSAGSAAGHCDREGVRADSTTGRRKARRNESRGAVQRLASLDRVLTELAAAQP
mmetsp:Transcript_108136/g.214771  ORF Transcript_108136/g.214771 Transcript_108136/m.214771 type:complete len:339 (-) Transcript_108136:252-1268(-)